MDRYGRAFKERAVARLLPPESSPEKTVSRELGVSVSTLERWRAEALSQPEGKRIWTAAARLEAVIATAAMDAEAKNAWCREKGLYPNELETWRQGAPCRARRGARQSAADAPDKKAYQGAGA